jgi:septal ring factor EnvC (AmiA/AmiB activator)
MLCFAPLWPLLASATSLQELEQLAAQLADLKTQYQQTEAQLAALSAQQATQGRATAQALAQWQHTQQSLLRLQQQPAPVLLLNSLWHNTPPRAGLRQWLLGYHQQQLTSHQQAALRPLQQWQQLVAHQRELEQHASLLSTELHEAHRAALRRARSLSRSNPERAAALTTALNAINPNNPLPAADPCPTSTTPPALPISATVYQTYCPQAQPPRHGVTLHSLPLAQLYSPSAGEITFSGKHGPSGWVVILTTTTGTQHIFAGLLSSPLTRGQQVQPQQPLGRTPATSPLLYWETRRSNSQPINPL